MEKIVEFLKTAVVEAFWDSPVTFSLAGVALLFLGWDRITRKRRLRKAAEKIADAAKVFEGDIEIAQVKLGEDFKRLDLEFYDRQGNALEILGFQQVADVEFVHVTKHNPWMRTCIRLFAPPHGEICAAVYHVRISGWRRLLCKMMGKADLYLTEFETEMSDSSFVLTTNSSEAGKLTQPDAIRMSIEPEDTAVPQLLQAHINHVKERLEQLPGARPRPSRTLDEVTAMQARFHALQQMHRQSLGGGVTTEELENCMDGGITEEDKEELKKQVLDIQSEKPEIPLRQPVEAPARDTAQAKNPFLAG